MAAMAPRTIPAVQEAGADHLQSALMALGMMVEQAAQARQMLTEPALMLPMLEAEAVVRVLLGVAGQAVPAGAVLEVMQAKLGQPGQ